MSSSSVKECSKVRLANPHINEKRDFLYHLGLSIEDGLVKRFHDVKFICIGGKGKRMKNFAELLYEVLDKPKNCEFEEGKDEDNRQLKDIAGQAGRYSMYKVGPVISASHGIGMASMSVVVHELLKLIFHAGCSNVSMIRIGTSGGMGIEPGTVVITNQAYNGLLEPHFRQVSCGKEIIYDSKTDSELVKGIKACAESMNLKTVVGNTVSTNDFYEEQGRLDGALCSFTLEDKMEFLNRAHDDYGVVNMEMESACFAAMCSRTNVKCAVVCVTLLNRLLGDQVTTSPSTLHSWEGRPQDLIAEFIKRSTQAD